ncbi:MAG: proprotein convertase P-domain-containing protein [Chitinophagaceae bacterium]|nr:proprotein convertase P-domain-containing protein [Chitinophagaceae bacterium]
MQQNYSVKIIGEIAPKSQTAKGFQRYLTLLLLPLLLFMGQSANSQCTFASSFGSATINTGGTVVQISTCSFAGEYSTISGAVNGQTLRFTSSIATDYITIHSGSAAGPVVAFGQTPLSFANTFTGTLYAHWSSNAACGTQSTCRTTTVQCTSCTPPAAPANDLCINALPINCGQTINATTTGAALDVVPTCVTTLSSAPGVWYTFTGDGSNITLSLCGSSYDTKLGVFSGTCAALTCVTGNDDFCSLQSQVTFTSVFGTTYYVLVTGFSTNSGNFTWPGPVRFANEACAGATTINCGQTINGTTTGATLDAVPTCVTSLNTAPGRWYTFPGDGSNVTLSLCGSAYDTKIGVFSGNCGGLVCVTGNDDFCGTQSQVTFTSVIGTTYYVLVTGFSTASGNFTLARTCVSPCNITLSSAAGTNNQTVCNSAPIVNITYNTTGATGATVTGLPAGVTGTWAANVVTISGSPTANGTFNYTVNLTGCPGTTATGTITVNPSPAAPVITPNPAAVCLGFSTPLSATTGPGSTGTCTTSSGAISVLVPDNNPAGITSTLNVSCVPAGATITGIDVTINMTHTWDGDMIINLKSPNNEVLNLINARGGSGDNFVNTVISSASANPLSAGTPPFTGTFMADGNAANPPTAYPQTTTTFPAMYPTPNGNWILAMRDNAGGDVGTLTSWSIKFNYNTPLAPVAVIWSPATELYTNVGATTPYVAGTPLATVYAKPTVTRTYSAVIPSVPCPSLPASVTVTVNPNPVIAIVDDPQAALPGRS